MIMYLLLVVAFSATAIARPVQRVIGGESVPDITTYPFMISLRYLGTHSCGAMLISLEKAVTAAHCIGNPLNTYEIMAGSSDRLCASSGTSPDCSRRPLSAAVRHPDFVNSGVQGYPNDVAVITFGQQLLPSATNRDIQLASSATSVTAGTIMGWGRLAPYGDLATVLQRISSVTVISEEECQQNWSSVTIDYQRQVCISDTADPKRGPCNGDSGGPLVVGAGTIANPYVLVGVMSWGGIECDTNRPSVYSRVSYYADWINSQ